MASLFLWSSVQIVRQAVSELVEVPVHQSSAAE